MQRKRKEGEKMPRRIQPPKEKFKRELQAKVEYIMKINDITYKDLEELFSKSKPTINKLKKDPGEFKVKQLESIARVCKSRLKISFERM